MALANMGLDLLGQARELYSYAAKVEGKGNDEDKFAYLRDVRQYRNLLLLEQPNGDFARTMVRQFFYAAFADLYWRAMMKSSDATLAAIAAKSEKESAYHLRHSSEWIVRLGDGTEESHARAQTAIDDLWAFTGEMFGVDDSERGLIDAGIAIDPAALRPQWLKTVTDVVSEATLVAAEERLDAAGRPQRPAQRASRPSPQRIAVDAADLSGGDMVAAVLNDADLRQRAWDAAAQRGRSRNSGADHRRSRRAARRRGRATAVSRSRSRRPIPAVPAMNMIALEIELALERDGIRGPKIRTVLSPAWTTDWMSEDGRSKLREYGIAPPQAVKLAAARCSASSRWRARNAAPTIPKCCPNSARPPARRCGAARAAASRSTISSVTDHVRHCSSALPPPSPSTICAAKIRRRGVADLCDPERACRRLQLCARAISDPAHDDGRRGSAPLLFDLLRPRRRRTAHRREEGRWRRVLELGRG